MKDGDPVTLKCEVKGQPQPEIQWYKDGKVLVSSKDFNQSYSGDIAKLVISDVLSDDAGEYVCIAKNTSGEVETACQLVVEGRFLTQESLFGPHNPHIPKSALNCQWL